jgi:hypothetical protein
MNDNIIAICLYIGIMAMAGTVLVLTIVYFVRPNPAKKAQSESAGINPVIEGTKPARKKLQLKFPAVKLKLKKNGKDPPASADIKPITGAAQKAVHKLHFKFPVIKMKLKKTDGAVILKKLPKMQSKAVVAPVVAMKKPESLEKPIALPVETNKAETKEKPSAPDVAAEKAPTQEVTAVKPAVEVHPEKNEVKPEIKAVAKLEINPGPAITAQPVPVKSEKPEQPVPKETPKPVVTAAVPLPQLPSAEKGKPKPDAAVRTINEKEKPAAVEAVKKEPEPKMDNKNVKTVTTAAAENPQTPPVTVKTTTTTTTTASSAVPKKAPDQKPSLDDFSQMFAKEVVDDSEATKLAKDMKEVEVNNLLKEGQDLVALLKRGRS